MKLPNLPSYQIRGSPSPKRIDSTSATKTVWSPLSWAETTRQSIAAIAPSTTGDFPNSVKRIEWLAGRCFRRQSEMAGHVFLCGGKHAHSVTSRRLDEAVRVPVMTHAHQRHRWIEGDRRDSVGSHTVHPSARLNSRDHRHAGSKARPGLPILQLSLFNVRQLANFFGRPLTGGPNNRTDFSFQPQGAIQTPKRQGRTTSHRLSPLRHSISGDSTYPVNSTYAWPDTDSPARVPLTIVFPSQ